MDHVALGVIGATAIVGFNVQGIIQGVLVAGVTVFANQLIHQTINKQTKAQREINPSGLFVCDVMML